MQKFQHIMEKPILEKLPRLVGCNVHIKLFSSDIFFSTTETMILNQKLKGFGERCMGVFIDKVLSDSNSDPPPPPLQQYRTIAHTPTRIFQFPSYNLLEYLSLYSLKDFDREESVI